MTSMRVVAICEPEDTYTAVIESKIILQKAGFDATSQALMGTAVSELATNILRYAGEGELCMSIITEGARVGFELQAIDAGPGIVDVEQAFTEHYSTTKNSLGLGLSSIKRLMDECSVDSEPGQGTIIVARKWKK